MDTYSFSKVKLESFLELVVKVENVSNIAFDKLTILLFPRNFDAYYGEAVITNIEAKSHKEYIFYTNKEIPFSVDASVVYQEEEANFDISLFGSPREPKPITTLEMKNVLKNPQMVAFKLDCGTCAFTLLPPHVSVKLSEKSITAKCY